MMMYIMLREKSRKNSNKRRKNYATKMDENMGNYANDDGVGNATAFGVLSNILSLLCSASIVFVCIRFFYLFSQTYRIAWVYVFVFIFRSNFIVIHLLGENSFIFNASLLKSAENVCFDKQTNMIIWANI